MSIHEFMNELISYTVVLPAAALCFFPMKNQLKYPLGKILQHMTAILGISLPVLAFFSCYLKSSGNTFLFPLLILFFFLYHKNLTVHISKSLAIYAYVCALMALLSNFATGFDAILNPHSGVDTFSMAGSLFQFFMNTVLALIFARPFTKYGSLLVDRLNLPHVWYTTIALSSLFLFVNVLLRPLDYRTLYTNRVFLVFWGILAMMFSTLLLLTFIFYFIVSGIIREMETAEKNRFLEMRESQYIKQQRYMKATAEERHNFRQTIHTLENLARENDIDAIKNFLMEYVTSMPKNDVVSFCTNHAVNALLNYYAESVDDLKADMDWHIEFPKDTDISDTDLCSIIGNLLENAIAACRNVPEDDRFIDLSITTTEADTYLCIVMTNPFHGKLRKSGENYISTRRNGTGIGLSSIRSMAEQYGGVAKFSDTDGEFFSDVMMLIKKPT